MDSQDRNVTTVVLVDDHQIVRQGLQALLTVQPDFEVLGEASDGLQALEMVRRLRPNVLIIDVKLPDLSGIEVVKNVHAEFPETKAIVFTAYASEDYVLPAFASG